MSSFYIFEEKKEKIILLWQILSSHSILRQLFIQKKTSDKKVEMLEKHHRKMHLFLHQK